MVRVGDLLEEEKALFFLCWQWHIPLPHPSGYPPSQGQMFPFNKPAGGAVLAQRLEQSLAGAGAEQVRVRSE